MIKAWVSLLLITLGITLGIGLQQLGLIPVFISSTTTSSMNMGSEKEKEKEKDILYWVAPMDANFRRDKAGKSPMGMDLVPIYAGDQSDEQGIVKISPVVVNNLGVRTATVSRGKLWRRIDALGHITYDENKMSHVHLRTEGWIERLSVKAKGDHVRRGQLLFQLYSPELVNAQEEFVQAKRSVNKGLIKASQRRLLALGMTKGQITRLGKSQKVSERINIYAPQNGVVSALNIREGMFIKPTKTIMDLADLSTVWLIADIFERQADWVKIGQSVEAQLPYQPGKIWEGIVDYIYPDLDPVTRTLRVRMKFANPDESLKPNMYAKVVIYGGAKNEVLSIPQEALIRSGSGERVIIDLGEGRYQARFVTAGIETGRWVEIISGLDVGDKVVTSAQFLIDSEASLNASFSRMSEPMSDNSMLADPEATQSSAKGTINKIMAQHNKINISHEAIEAFGWPAMTMDLEVADTIDLMKFSEQQAIHFELEKQGDEYIIQSIHPLEEMQ